MSFPQSSAAVTIITAADGTATGYTEAIRGRIVAFKYTKVDYADGVDFTVTTEDSLRDVWVDININSTESVVPRLLCDGTDGADLTAVYDYIRLFNERVKIVIAQGGNAKSGTFTVYYE